MKIWSANACFLADLFGLHVTTTSTLFLLNDVKTLLMIPLISLCVETTVLNVHTQFDIFFSCFLLHIFIEKRANVNKFCFVIIMWIFGVCDEFMVAIEGTLGWSKFYIEFYSKYLYWSVFWTISEFLQNNHCYDYKPEVENPQRTITWKCIVLLTELKGW